MSEQVSNESEVAVDTISTQSSSSPSSSAAIATEIVDNLNETKPLTATFNGDTALDHEDIIKKLEDVINKSNQLFNTAGTTPTPESSSDTASNAPSTPPSTQFTCPAKTLCKCKHMQTLPDFMKSNWDPLTSVDWDLEKPTQNCIHRIKKDIYNLYQDPAPGICVVPDNDDITRIHALVTGPFDTPYEGGFFYFLIRCPPNYPFKPPRVRLITTSNGTVRFNPNLYKNGKVCLSILGTWEGPAWLPSQSISSVLMSIQSLLNSTPYHNEPGYGTERHVNASKFYNDVIRHETIRVAVCENLENENFEPKLLRNAMVSSFLDYYDYYIETCKANLHKDNEQMTDLLFNEKRGNFKYNELLKRLENIKVKLDELGEKSDDDENDESSNSNRNENANISKSSSLDEDDEEKK